MDSKEQEKIQENDNIAGNWQDSKEGDEEEKEEEQRKQEKTQDNNKSAGHREESGDRNGG